LKRFGVLVAVLLLTTIAAASVARAHRAQAATTTVRVSGKEFKFTLSRGSGPRGAFVFKFKNIGHIAHDFKIAGKKTPLLQPGKSATLSVRIAKAGRYRYLCTVPGHAAAGMKGSFVVK
jgi:plastocyanin